MIYYKVSGGKKQKKIIQLVFCLIFDGEVFARCLVTDVILTGSMP